MKKCLIILLSFLMLTLSGCGRGFEFSGAEDATRFSYESEQRHKQKLREQAEDWLASEISVAQLAKVVALQEKLSAFPTLWEEQDGIALLVEILERNKAVTDEVLRNFARLTEEDCEDLAGYRSLQARLSGVRKVDLPVLGDLPQRLSLRIVALEKQEAERLRYAEFLDCLERARQFVPKTVHSGLQKTAEALIRELQSYTEYESEWRGEGDRLGILLDEVELICADMEKVRSFVTEHSGNLPVSVRILPDMERLLTLADSLNEPDREVLNEEISLLKQVLKDTRLLSAKLENITQGYEVLRMQDWSQILPTDETLQPIIMYLEWFEELSDQDKRDNVHIKELFLQFLEYIKKADEHGN